MLLGVSEGLVHRCLSALLAHHRCPPGSTPRRTTPDVVTPVGDETARGLSDASPRSASFSGQYRKCQVCQRAKNGRRTSASSNDSHSPPATPLLQPPPAAQPPDGPREALPHMLWDNSSRTIAPFGTENSATFLRTVLGLSTNIGRNV
ncbi:hypothetical protein TcCL_Unassigned00952 [Trypanosoma cruzi]|nr:hypothetical protein TcCL_Unassigned00952 [Trypanosoma cruzi]